MPRFQIDQEDRQNTKLSFSALKCPHAKIHIHDFTIGAHFQSLPLWPYIILGPIAAKFIALFHWFSLVSYDFYLSTFLFHLNPTLHLPLSHHIVLLARCKVHIVSFHGIVLHFFFSLIFLSLLYIICLTISLYGSELVV